MQYIDTDKIVVKDNIRKDYGNIDELAASIRLHGIRKPLILTQQNELRDGHRRLKAATTNDLRQVPYVIQDTDVDKTVDQITFGIFGKNLTVLEESQAYDAYIKKTKCSVETLAKTIGKKSDYIKRRLNLRNLAKKALEALDQGQIEIGHAQMLSQMTEKQQKICVQEIIDNDLTVQNFADQIRFIQSIDFGDIEFRPKESGKQTTLDKIGKEMRPLHGRKFSPEGAAFRKELAAYVEGERQKLRDKGITVFSSEEGLLKKHPQAAPVSSWGADYAVAVKGLSKGKTFAVLVSVDPYSGVHKEVYRLTPKPIPKAERINESPAKIVNDPNASVQERQEAEQILNLNKQEKLRKRVELWRIHYLEEKGETLVIPGRELTALLLYDIMKRYGSGMLYGEEEKSETPQVDIQEFFTTTKDLDENALQKLLTKEAGNILRNVKQKKRDLYLFAQSFGFSWKKHFELTEDYLASYTKDSLLELAKEFGWNTEQVESLGKEKRTGIVEQLIASWKKGQVPKILCEQG